MVTSVMGLDMSLRATGQAVWRSVNDSFGARTVKTTSDLPAEARWALIIAHVLPAITSRTLVVMEDVWLGLKGRVALDLAMLHGAVRRELFSRNVPVILIPPTTLKEYATGHGNADKPAMVVAAKDAFSNRCAVGDDNQADALWLAAMGLHHYGHPLHVPELFQSAVLHKMSRRFPAWRLEV